MSELTGALLDLWVARAEGETLATAKPEFGRYWLKQGDCGSVKECPSYSTDWAHGGPIIERERMAFRMTRNDEIVADLMNDSGIGLGVGPTHLVAAMCAYVASKFGDEVEGTASQAANKGGEA